MNGYESPWMTPELATFRESVRKFLTAEFLPHEERWKGQGYVDREAWRRAGEMGLLCTDIPEEYGGAGGTFAHEAILAEALAYLGISGFGNAVHSIVAHYVLNHGSEAQKRKWLPAMARGELITAIAMSEPGAGSDLQGVKTRA